MNIFLYFIFIVDSENMIAMWSDSSGSHIPTPKCLKYLNSYVDWKLSKCQRYFKLILHFAAWKRFLFLYLVWIILVLNEVGDTSVETDLWWKHWFTAFFMLL